MEEVLAAITLALAALAGLTYFAILPKPSGHVRAVWKTLPVSMLALYAFLMNAPSPLVMALVLSALGDAFLAYDGKHNFAAALVSFLIAHVAYGWLFFMFGDRALVVAEIWRLGAAIVSVALVIALVAYLWRSAASLAPAVLAYATAIASMAVLSLSMPSLVVFAGVALFLSSDAVLSVQTFKMERTDPLWPFAAFYVWASYFGAQVGLTIALVALTA
ncbi:MULTISPECIES: lysoplasmalogenase [Alphaproteobacteria]|uniref:Lysoplasmalogenase n=2 Tax=Alphaproteobacteria TaxID=28211 RepID=A0A512HLH7_9HYPH|nr:MULTISPECIES: lysoplasmalogenase [Alphaproteobacteria]GEO86306.1 lysoplasmalogenase [Ciceribacter naphthalenivorans]GLR21788.1 lysoplasmalogenase [Ciceribacter naphthalenivorans]GLT04644.1 lysoplasmalogenase [Sphingomonas psychrolutea]